MFRDRPLLCNAVLLLLFRDSGKSVQRYSAVAIGLLALVVSVEAVLVRRCFVGERGQS